MQLFHDKGCIKPIFIRALLVILQNLASKTFLNIIGPLVFRYAILPVYEAFAVSDFVLAHAVHSHIVPLSPHVIDGGHALDPFPVCPAQPIKVDTGIQQAWSILRIHVRTAELEQDSKDFV